MQKGQKLSFSCQSCKHPVYFSLFELTKEASILVCDQCSKKYLFKDENLIRQLEKFTSLCSEIQNAEEILANTTIGIDMQNQQVKIPFKILLTRFTSYLDLIIGQDRTPISFRFEPCKDMEENPVQLGGQNA